MENENNTFYQLGVRDTIANLFMEIRINGEKDTLKRLAGLLPENPHTEFYLKNNI